MGTAENLVLVATDPGTGKVRIGSLQRDALLGGAFLLDLAMAGRTTVEPPTKKGKVVVVDPTPVEDPILQQAFARIRSHGRLAPSTAVGRLGKKGLDLVLDRLVDTGRLRRREQRHLAGLVRLHRYDDTDPARREQLVERVRAVLLGGHPANAETGPLVGLLAASGSLPIVVHRSEVKAAKARARDVSSADWASEGVRQAIEATQTTLLVTAVIGGVVAGSS
ncbi:GPP34 family phosphoprotein [Aeromicrobium sp. Leaf350]|uniref:GOLPH3/VPS74 family protein n=1 Tax=Aeromicrobium sp. Leaf350 TaxID=2876565 RepID=UPI001E35CC17|nr:GPP34 family phosphoprotein [Aeromicrobium sp. Leaf350]